jgi:hypothetical protein
MAFVYLHIEDGGRIRSEANNGVTYDASQRRMIARTGRASRLHARLVVLWLRSGLQSLGTHRPTEDTTVFTSVIRPWFDKGIGY